MIVYSHAVGCKIVVRLYNEVDFDFFFGLVITYLVSKKIISSLFYRFFAGEKSQFGQKISAFENQPLFKLQNVYQITLFTICLKAPVILSTCVKYCKKKS